ncbi:receptor activity-modifying protein 2 isoform X2 [Scomber scombrus]|uniref:Receptor activity-modifying protein 2 isoform X2 n=1 Tax=Scomber scombrus TaxID=13677 RepID=A0AAV1NSR4_SCOSC
MTATSFSLMFSGCFVTLLIWGHTTVFCLVAENVATQRATTVGYESTRMMNNTTYGFTNLSSGCGNSSHCVHYCDFCSGVEPIMDCLPHLLSNCVRKFETAMESLNSTDWCIWSNVNSLYSNLSICTEDISDCLLIPWPNQLVELLFVQIHSMYFKDCPTEELRDPPPVIVFALVITPICLIPAMVSLVVLKTKNGDGSS